MSAGAGPDYHVVAKLNEVSVIRTGIAAYRGAQVTPLYELPQRAKPADTGQVFYGGAVLHRHIGKVLGVR